MEALKEALAVNRGLEVLKLVQTQLRSEGAVTIAELLPETKTLRHLDLTQNALGVAGIMAICVSLRLNKSIHQLDLDADPADPNEANLLTEVAAVCERNRSGSNVHVKRSELVISPSTQVRPSFCFLGFPVSHHHRHALRLS